MTMTRHVMISFVLLIVAGAMCTVFRRAVARLMWRRTENSVMGWHWRQMFTGSLHIDMMMMMRFDIEWSIILENVRGEKSALYNLVMIRICKRRRLTGSSFSKFNPLRRRRNWHDKARVDRPLTRQWTIIEQKYWHWISETWAKVWIRSWWCWLNQQYCYRSSRTMTYWWFSPKYVKLHNGEWWRMKWSIWLIWRWHDRLTKMVHRRLGCNSHGFAERSNRHRWRSEPVIYWIDPSKDKSFIRKELYLVLNSSTMTHRWTEFLTRNIRNTDQCIRFED